jgi:uncharacterized protein (DUF1697 family)
VTTHIALLRGVNVGGRASLAMADLRALVETLGFSDVRTLLQSGNVVFRGAGKAADIEQQLERETEKRFGARIDHLIRSPKEWRAMIADNPFATEAIRDPSHTVAMFLKAKPQPSAVSALQVAIRGRETVRAGARHLYIVYPDGIGTSKFTGALIEAKLGTRGTARNWNTVLKLATLAGDGT